MEEIQINDSRSVLHCDLDNFFASVESVFNPEYKKVPMAVCGSVEDRHGIVLAKNPLAKKYGIKTAQPVWQAQKLCPELVICQPHYDRYVEFSHKARAIYEDYTDMIEPFGIDECWLDVTGSKLLFGSAVEIARQINTRMKAETGLTVSVGVSFNKCFAKLGSDLNKPDGISVITKENYRSLVWSLPVEALLWVGRSTLKKLNDIGVYTVGDAARIPVEALTVAFGVNGQRLQLNALGLDDSPVTRETQAPAAKSIGKSTTGRTDLITDEQVYRTLLYLSEDVSKQLREQKFTCSTVQIHLRDTKLEVEEHMRQLDIPTRLAKGLADAAFELYNEYWDKSRPLRSVGIRAVKLLPESEDTQLCFGHDYEKDEKSEQLEASVEKLRTKFGKGAVKRASLL